MRRKKSNLDEMQEQELLKVEHNGCWIVFWGPAGRDHHTKHPVWKPRLQNAGRRRNCIHRAVDIHRSCLRTPGNLGQAFPDECQNKPDT